MNVVTLFPDRISAIPEAFADGEYDARAVKRQLIKVMNETLDRAGVRDQACRIFAEHPGLFHAFQRLCGYFQRVYPLREHALADQCLINAVAAYSNKPLPFERDVEDRKSTRLNSSHG